MNPELRAAAAAIVAHDDAVAALERIEEPLSDFSVGDLWRSSVDFAYAVISCVQILVPDGDEVSIRNMALRVIDMTCPYMSRFDRSLEVLFEEQPKAIYHAAKQLIEDSKHLLYIASREFLVGR